MTLAICIKCGAEKIGALTPCHACGFDPETPEDQAKGILLCDHNMSADDLRAAAAKVRSGEPLEFDEAAIAEIAEELGDEEAMKMPLGCTIAVWTPVVIMLILLAIVAALLLFILANRVAN